MRHIEIWQAKRDIDEDFSFMSYDYTSKKINLKQYQKYYNKVYEYDSEEYETLGDSIILNKLFEIFNINRPDDFKGHSMSVSDIIKIDDSIYYCDSFGFKELN